MSFPWSKDHGSIEAPGAHVAAEVAAVFPWSKDHGSIEARRRHVDL